jgi:predicted MFS family arabinose efflux permease
MPSVMATDIVQKFQIDSTMFGQFAGIYYLGYSLMHIPVGIMLDSIGPKKIMPICIFLTIFGLLPLIFTEFWVYPVLGRLITGMGSSAAILGAFKIIRLVFTGNNFNRMMSLFVAVGLFGGIYGGGPLNYMCSVLGYYNVILILFGLGALLAVLSYYFVPTTEANPSYSVLASIKEVVGNGKIMAICFFSGCMVGPLEGFADVWGTVFLQQVRGLDKTLAASLPSAIFIGMSFGTPILNYIAEKTKNPLGTIVVAGLVMLISFIVLLSYNLNPIFTGVVLTTIGICCAYQMIALYQTSSYVTEDSVALTTAIVNMCVMIFGYFFHTAIGWIIGYMGGVSKIALTYGVAFIPAVLVVGIIGFGLIMLVDSYRQKMHQAVSA